MQIEFELAMLSYHVFCKTWYMYLTCKCMNGVKCASGDRDMSAVFLTLFESSHFPLYRSYILANSPYPEIYRDAQRKGYHPPPQFATRR